MSFGVMMCARLPCDQMPSCPCCVIAKPLVQPLVQLQHPLFSISELLVMLQGSPMALELAGREEQIQSVSAARCQAFCSRPQGSWFGVLEGGVGLR